MAAPAVRAQNIVNEFSLGNQLLNEGKFEEAYEIFSRLLEQNPRSHAMFDRTVNALLSLKRYEEALELCKQRLEQNPDDVNTLVKLGETYHVIGQQEEAFATWSRLLEIHPLNINAYRRVADVMNQRRLFRDAIAVYNQARQSLNDPDLFRFELANNYLAVSMFDEAVEEYLEILTLREQLLSQIQRQLLNYDERRLYDTAIIRTEQRLARTRSGSDTDLIYREFLVWLNMERGLYRRALAAARVLDRNSDYQKQSMFRIGRQLRGLGEFELAEQAFRFYLDLEHHSLQARSFEELSRTYQSWAGYLQERNLAFAGETDTLYRKAFDTVERLLYRYPRYERVMQTLVIQSELALDHLKRVDLAVSYHEKMENLSRLTGSGEDLALTSYVEGRILLFQGEFALARVAFTRSNRLAEKGETAEKSRYYLGLGDFYHTDFSYARLQLRALERINHSWHANDALHLRYLIQQAHDTDSLAQDDDYPAQDTDYPAQDADYPGRDTDYPAQDADYPAQDTVYPGQNDDNRELKRYAQARYLYDTGRYADAAVMLLPAFDQTPPWALHNEQLLLLSRSLRRIHPAMAYHVLDFQMKRPSIRRHAGEQLLWERARLADLMLSQTENTDMKTSATNEASETVSAERSRVGSADRKRSAVTTDIRELAELLESLSAEELFFRYPDTGRDVVILADEVIASYEDLLIAFPDGFYADIARSRIRELEQSLAIVF